MKYLTILATALLAATPGLLLADPATDRNIEQAAEASYNFRAVLDNQVHVKAKDGIVTLTGTVSARDQKMLAENTVRSLPGVERVDNKIEVSSSGAGPSDGWVALKVRSALLLHAHVSVASTDVTVHDGVVTLTGTAGSEAQKELTTAYVQDIDGVKDVKNDMQVRSTAMEAVDAGHDTMGDKIDDASITAQVKYELLTHRATSAVKTSVETHDGAVKIHGNASSAAEKDLVTHLARDIKGVVSVDNEMTVRAGE